MRAVKQPPAVDEEGVMSPLRRPDDRLFHFVTGDDVAMH
jgi:hypothetical protein